MENPSKSIRTKVPKSFCTTAEAANRLGVSIRTIQLWSESGLLKAWKTSGGHRRITLDSVERLLASQTRSPSNGETAVPDASRFKIMVVDDEPDLLTLYRLQLQRWSFDPDVTVAGNGFEALLRIGRSQPDLLITDLKMPYVDGFEMIRKLRSLPELAEMAIVVVSALTPAQIAQRGGLSSNIPVLPKPVPFTELRQIAERLALSSRGSGPEQATAERLHTSTR